MRTISNTLEPVMGTWTDPGDYPSGAGSCRLPGSEFIESFTGDIVVEMDPDDLLEMEGDTAAQQAEYVEENMEHGIRGLEYPKWRVKTTDGVRFALTLDDFESARMDWD